MNEEKIVIEGTRGTIEEINKKLLSIVDECKWNIGEEGISITAVDPAHVGMVSTDIPKENFERWEIDEEVEIGLNLKKLKKYLKIYGKKEVLTMEIAKGCSHLILKGEKITHRMPLLDTAGMRSQSMPDLSDLPARFKCKAKSIKKALKGISNISDHFGMAIDEDSISLYTQEDEDSFELVLPREDLEELKSDGGFSSLFAHDYASNMFKTISASTTLDIHMGEDYPIKIDFDYMDDDEENCATCTFMLAPRIEAE